MKFHYQYVSKNSVRIELIPEDPKEKKLFEEIPGWDREDLQLRQFYQSGLENYSTGTALIRINFMSFPKVAICTFAQTKPIEKVA
jgi:hypothetical protein